MATRSHDYLVSPAYGIEGSKLPSGKQVLGYFLYHHTIRKEIVHLTATHTILFDIAHAQLLMPWNCWTILKTCSSWNHRGRREDLVAWSILISCYLKKNRSRK